MWVPEWPCVAPCRHRGSTAAMTVSPSTNSPDSTLTRCAHSVLAIFCTSVTAALAVPDVPVPVIAALVGDLTARLGVERGAVQDQLDALGAGRLAVVRHHRYPLAVDEDTENLCLGGQFVEAGELRRAGVDQVAVGRQIGVGLLAGGGVGLGALALLGHQAAEAFFVDGQAGLGGHLERQVDREAVGVVQRERVGPRQHGGARRPSSRGRPRRTAASPTPGCG